MSQTVKPGYKQTEIGVIPGEWQVKPLRSVLSKGRLGGNYPNQDRETEYPLMKMGNLGRGYMATSKVEYITRGVTPEVQHKLKKGDVLFNTRNTLDLVGKVAIWRDELPLAYYNSNLMRLEFDPQQVCSTEYANAALNTVGAITVLRGLATGTTSVAAIYTRDLIDMPFITPPLPEQRAIATALSDVDALLAALDRLIAKQRDLKQAAMQQLLTGQTRLPGFTGKWKMKPFGQLYGEPSRNGVYKTSEFHGRGTRIVNMGEMFGFDFISDQEMNRVSLTTKEMATNGLRDGDLLFGRRSVVPSGAGKCSIVVNPPEPLIFESSIIRVRLNQEVADPLFHYYFFASPTGRLVMSLIISGTNVKGIRGSELRDLEIPHPPLPEQTAIATVLSAMDLELAALEQRRDKTRALKQGMMQELLTGRTRLL